MAFDRSQYEALNPAHPHPQCQKLHGKCFPGPRGPQKVQVGVLVHLGIKQIHNAKGIIMSVHTKQYTGIIGHLKAGEHISGRRPAGQHISLGLFFQRRMYL